MMIAQAWDGSPLPPWPSGLDALNPFAWLIVATERGVLREPPPGYGPGDQARVRAAGGLAAITKRVRDRETSSGLRRRQEDEYRDAAFIHGRGPQELRTLALVQRLEAEHIAYAEMREIWE